MGGFDQSFGDANPYVSLMTKWDPTRTELAGFTQLVVTLGGRSHGMVVEEGSFNDNLMVFGIGMPHMITLLQNYKIFVRD